MNVCCRRRPLRTDLIPFPQIITIASTQLCHLVCTAPLCKGNYCAHVTDGKYGPWRMSDFRVEGHVMTLALGVESRWSGGRSGHHQVGDNPFHPLLPWGRAARKPGMASVQSSDAECLKGAKLRPGLGGRKAREVMRCAEQQPGDHISFLFVSANLTGSPF